MANQFYLLGKKNFLPLFITQSLGAFNDNLFKNSLVMLITYVVAEKSGMNAQLLVTLAAGIFIVPFFLLSATAGQLADKYEKSRMIKIIKFVEILIMIGAAIGLHFENTYILLFILFLMGAQSSFFGPLKYSIIPDHLDEDELIGGNALVEAGTFLAILMGTIIGGLLILTEGGAALVSAMIIGISVIGFIASLYIPKAPAAAADLKIGLNIFTETWKIMKFTTENKSVFLSIVGISWFWLVGATFLAQFPTYTKDILGGNEEVVTLLLTVFSVGIGVGSLLCNKLLKGEINSKYVPLGCIGMSIFIIDLYFASQNLPQYLAPAGFYTFISELENWRILFDLSMIAIFGGIYIVPLYAIMQSRSEKSYRARIIAGNNVMNALFMVISAIATLLMLKAGLIVTDVFLALAIVNFGVYFVVKKIVRNANAAAK